MTCGDMVFCVALQYYSVSNFFFETGHFVARQFSKSVRLGRRIWITPCILYIRSSMIWTLNTEHWKETVKSKATKQHSLSYLYYLQMFVAHLSSPPTVIIWPSDFEIWPIKSGTAPQIKRSKFVLHFCFISCHSTVAFFLYVCHNIVRILSFKVATVESANSVVNEC